MANPHPLPGPGRPKGSKNKASLAAKEAFHLAFDGLGGAEALKEWAMRNRTDFYKLYSKLIPAETTVTLNSHEETLDDLK